MKTFSFIFPILLGIFCLLYLLFYPYQRVPLYHDFSAKVLAVESNTHDTISNALPLTLYTKHKEKIEPHETLYYYISNHNNMSFSMTSRSINTIKATLLSDSGNQIPCHIHKKNNSYILTPSEQEKIRSQRIFLRVTNPSISSCNLQLQVTSSLSDTKKTHKNNNKKESINKEIVTPTPHNNTASNPNKSATPKPNNTTLNSNLSLSHKEKKHELSTIPLKKVKLYPQFYILSPNTVQKLTIKNCPLKDINEQFIWLSTNPEVATVVNNKVSTHSEGITIIYLQDKKHTKNTSTCVIRVIQKNKIIRLF